MKAIIVFVFAVAAIANAQTGFRPQPKPALENHRENPHGYLVRSRRNEQICIQGSTKQEDCNTCICVAGGTEWGCTRMECTDDYNEPYNPLFRSKRDLGSRVGNPLKNLLRVVRSKQICTEGETRPDDCNTCICVAGGTAWSCTRMECPPE